MCNPKKIILILFLVIGCEKTSTEPEGTLSVKTDSNEYAGIARVAFVLKNDSKSTVYFLHCNYHIAFYIERKDSSWVDAGSNGIECQAKHTSGLMELKPNESIRDTFFIPQSGTLRLKFPYSLRQESINQKFLYSNEYYNFNPR